METMKLLKSKIGIGLYSLFIFFFLGNCKVKEINNPDHISNRFPNCVLPVIGAWFWGEEEMEPDGFKYFIDQVSTHSPYNLLTTSIRMEGQEVTNNHVHNQVEMAVRYARQKGIHIALDLDIRLARRAFEAKYPDELQELLRLQKVGLSMDDTVETVVRSIDLSDHMTGRTTHYIPLRSALLRVYSYRETANGIDANTLKEITGECVVKTATKDSVVIRIPPVKKYSGAEACVMVAFTHLTPDVFSPHLIEFQREIIHRYGDVPLEGGMKDEWGFPPSREPLENQFWYSKHTALAYSQKTGGRDLLYDCLLMYVGVKGQESIRIKSINHFMEMNLQRNGAIENDFYNTVKKVFGLEAVIVTHPTWHSQPFKTEYKKNGLDWWIATRDWAQTDESAPFSVRTSLEKKWNSPVCYNQFYATDRKKYQKELWSSILAGGRINYHPLHPSDYERSERHINLFRGNLMKGESRVRLLNFISQSPVDCPVAVIFGHPCTMNWAGPFYNDVGMELVNSLWSRGIPADLIPSSEIGNNSLVVDKKGWICYGPQRYSAVVLYHPEFEKRTTADFFQKASDGKTEMFRVGNWTRDFNGQAFNGNSALPESMVEGKNNDAIVSEIEKILEERGIAGQSPAIRSGKRIIHPTTGFCRLIDGTVVYMAGTNDVGGDPIIAEVNLNGLPVFFDAIGIAAVRLDREGKIQALAAGGLKSFKAGNFEINLDQRIDLALWTTKDDRYQGVLQGWTGKVPLQLLAITKEWKKLRIPEPLSDKN